MNNKDRKASLRALLELGIDPITIILTATITILFSIISGFANDEGVLYIICDRGFYISLSVVMLQSLIQNFFINEKSEMMADAIDVISKNSKSTQCVVFPERKSFINNKIEDALNSNKIRKMKIICYGTSKFGRVIDSIITTYTSVEVDVIVCSPDEDFFDLKSDKQLLINVIEELQQAKNIHVYTSTIPPTLRACVMYIDNDRPVFCSMQPYYLFSNENYKIFKGEGFSPTIIADSENEIFLMHLVSAFNKEFNRLMNSSVKVDDLVVS